MCVSGGGGFAASLCSHTDGPQQVAQWLAGCRGKSSTLFNFCFWRTSWLMQRCNDTITRVKLISCCSQAVCAIFEKSVKTLLHDFAPMVSQLSEMLGQMYSTIPQASALDLTRQVHNHSHTRNNTLQYFVCLYCLDTCRCASKEWPVCKLISYKVNAHTGF